jgi:hypothetical protein
MRLSRALCLFILFEPIQFDGCVLKWRRSYDSNSPTKLLKQFHEVWTVTVPLAELDPKLIEIKPNEKSDIFAMWLYTMSGKEAIALDREMRTDPPDKNTTIDEKGLKVSRVEIDCLSQVNGSATLRASECLNLGCYDLAWSCFLNASISRKASVLSLSFIEKKS